ncbi:MAG: hypothetical protein ACTSU9_13555 [Promethearchaeota archaeon]
MGTSKDDSSARSPINFNLNRDTLCLLLGEPGFVILERMVYEALDFVDIQDITGLPGYCLYGRIEKMIDLGLVRVENGEFSMTRRGLKVLERLWRGD